MKYAKIGIDIQQVGGNRFTSFSKGEFFLQVLDLFSRLIK
jgi:hypothetical protein